MNKEIYYCLINSHNTWHLKMRTPDGKQVLRSTGIKVPEGSKRDIERSKKEAQLKVPKIIDDYKKSKPNHTVVLTDKEDVTLADYAEYYNELNKSNIKITTYDNDKQKPDRYTLPIQLIADNVILFMIITTEYIRRNPYHEKYHRRILLW